jgi:hypothetical protein
MMLILLVVLLLQSNSKLVCVAKDDTLLILRRMGHCSLRKGTEIWGLFCRFENREHCVVATI